MRILVRTDRNLRVTTEPASVISWVVQTVRKDEATYIQPASFHHLYLPFSSTTCVPFSARDR